MLLERQDGRVLIVYRRDVGNFTQYKPISKSLFCIFVSNRQTLAELLDVRIILSSARLFETLGLGGS